MTILLCGILCTSIVSATTPAQEPVTVRTDTTTASQTSIESITSPPQNTTQGEWSYADCVERAKSNSIDVRRLALQYLQSDEDLKSAKDQWLPTVDFSTSQSYSNYPSPGELQQGNSYVSSYGISGSWTLWDGNVRKYKIESAKLLKRQSAFAIENQLDNLEIAIFKAYLNILYSNEAIEIAEQTLEVSTSQMERAKRLMESGRLSKPDYAQIESQQAQDAYSVVQAKSTHAQNYLQLKELLELTFKDDFSIKTVAITDEMVLAQVPDIESVFNAACAWNPQIKSNDLNASVFENDIKIAKAGLYPKISVNAGISTGYTTIAKSNWGNQISRSLNENIGLTLSIPIFDGNSTKRAVAKAKLAALEYELANDELHTSLSQAIETLFIENANQQAKYKSGLTQVETAQTTATLVDRQFDLGLVNPVELLTAHNNLLNARLELLQTKYMAVLSKKLIGFYTDRTITF